MALLVAVLLAGGRLAGDLEIIACKAAGISALRLFRPVLGAALVVTAITAVLTLVVNPLANQEFQRQLFKILQARASSGLAERVFNPTFGDVIIYVEDVSASQVALRGLLVSDERDSKISRIITAREGRLLTDEENRRITLRLINGAVSEADVLPAAPAVAAGGAPSSGGAASASRYRLTSFSIYDMSLSVDSPLRAVARGGEAGEGPLHARPRRPHRRAEAAIGSAGLPSWSSGTSDWPSRWPRSSSPSSRSRWRCAPTGAAARSRWWPAWPSSSPTTSC